MKKLLLLVGLVVFLTPMVVSAYDKDINNYHCVSTPEPSFGSDKTIRCFCMRVGGYKESDAYTSKVKESLIENLCGPTGIKINLGIYLSFKGFDKSIRKQRKLDKLEPLKDQKLIITKKEAKTWLKENKKLRNAKWEERSKTAPSLFKDSSGNNNQRNSNNERASNNNRSNQQNQRIYNPILEKHLNSRGRTQVNPKLEKILNSIGRSQVPVKHQKRFTIRAGNLNYNF